jgi:hypothetical protein
VNYGSSLHVQLGFFRARICLDLQYECDVVGGHRSVGWKHSADVRICKHWMQQATSDRGRSQPSLYLPHDEFVGDLAMRVLT